PREIRPVDAGPREVRLAQHRLAQIRVAEIRFHQGCAPQIRPEQHGAGEIRPVEFAFGTVNTAEVGTGEIGPRKVRFLHLAVGQSGPLKDTGAEPAVVGPELGEVCAGEITRLVPIRGAVAEPRLSQNGLAKTATLRIRKVSVAEIGAVENNASQVAKS